MDSCKTENQENYGCTIGNLSLEVLEWEGESLPPSFLPQN